METDGPDAHVNHRWTDQVFFHVKHVYKTKQFVYADHLKTIRIGHFDLAATE